MKAITVTTSGVRVTLAGGSGSMTASVVNQEATPTRVVVAVVAQGVPQGAATAGAQGAPPPTPSATVERALREIGPGATEQFLVTFAQGAAAPGTYPVRIVAYPSDEAPEEYAAGGQHVDVVVEDQALVVVPGRRFPWWVVAVAAALVLIVAVVVVVLTRPKSAVVPSVVTRTRAQAEQLIVDAGLDPSAKNKVGKPPFGVVTSQSPAAGAEVDRGTTVTFTVTIGVVPPNLTTKALAEAKAELEGLGLQVATVEQPSDVTAGTVLAQQPPAGTQLGVGDTVTLTVASPVLVEVPALVGSAQSIAQARLAAAGLQASVEVRDCLLGLPCVRVGASDPVAGTMVPRGSVVRLVVNRF